MESFDLLNTKFLDKIITVFILVLIICGNYLGQLFPCRVQQMFSNNNYLKHILGYLTLLFFAITTLPELNYLKSGFGAFSDFMLNSLILYIWFIFMSKNHYVFWFITFGLAGCMYLIYLYETTEKNNSEKDNKKYETSKVLITTKKTIGITILISTIIGFLVYMGAKKEEYGSKFNYITFLFGKPSCKGKSPVFKGVLFYLMNAFA